MTIARSGLSIYSSGYNDKYFSVVDCTSFIVMQDRTIGLAMGFDSDFEQMGFQLLPHV